MKKRFHSNLIGALLGYILESSTYIASESEAQF